MDLSEKEDAENCSFGQHDQNPSNKDQHDGFESVHSGELSMSPMDEEIDSIVKFL